MRPECDYYYIIALFDLQFCSNPSNKERSGRAVSLGLALSLQLLLSLLAAAARLVAEAARGSGRRLDLIWPPKSSRAASKTHAAAHQASARCATGRRGCLAADNRRSIRIMQIAAAT